MLIPFGIFSAAGIGSDYELIQSSILTSAAGSITFSGLGVYSSVYKHLQVRAVIRSTTGDNFDFTRLIFNGASSNLNNHSLFGNGSSVVSNYENAGSSINMWGSPGSTSTANLFASYVMDVLDPFSSTKNTTIRSLGGQTGENAQIILTSGLWRVTDSVTSMTFTSGDAASYAIGSRFSLYGIKG
jgi:hypothetical protein